MSIIRWIPWTEQPQYTAPVTDAYTAMLAPVWGADLGIGAPSSVSGTLAVTQNGLGITSPRATVYRPALGTSYTLIAIARGGTAASNQNILGGDDGGSNRHFQLRLNSTSGRFDFIRFTNAGVQFATTTASLTLSAPYVVVASTVGLSMRCSAGNVGGQLYSTATTAMTGVTPSSLPSTFPISVGSRDTALINAFSGELLGYIVLPYAISPSLDTAIIANPWQLFSPRKQRIWAPVSSSVAYNLTADSGSYLTTGQTASIYRNKILNAAQGSYSISGQDATITYTPTGTNYTITANHGTYSITGQAATLLRSKELVAAYGTYSLTGQSATVAYSGSNTITLKAGSWIRYRIIT